MEGGRRVAWGKVYYVPKHGRCDGIYMLYYAGRTNIYSDQLKIF